jgi:hypothetical protein
VIGAFEKQSERGRERERKKERDKRQVSIMEKEMASQNA